MEWFQTVASCNFNLITYCIACKSIDENMENKTKPTNYILIAAE